MRVPLYARSLAFHNTRDFPHTTLKSYAVTTHDVRAKIEADFAVFQAVVPLVCGAQFCEYTGVHSTTIYPQQSCYRPFLLP